MGFSIGKAIGGAVSGFVSGGGIGGAVIGGLSGGLSGDSGVGKATSAANAGLDQEIAYNRESRDIALGLNAPFQNASYSALNAMLSMTGLPSAGGQVDQSGRPVYDSSRIGTVGDAVKYATQLGYEGDDAKNLGQYIWDRQNGSIKGAQSDPRLLFPSLPIRSGMAPIKGYNGFNKPILSALYGTNNDPYGGMDKEFRKNVAPMMSAPSGGQAGEYDWQKDPGYAFRLAEGERALERRQAAGGQYMSGGAIREALRYNQNFATNEFNNIYNRLSSIAGFGPSVAANSGSAALQTGARMGLGAASKGYNRASGYIAKGEQKDDYLAEILGAIPGLIGSDGNNSGIIWN